MTDNEIFEEVKQRFTDPKVMDLLRNGLADPEEMEVVKRALRYGNAAMTIPSLRSILYKVFDRLLNVVKDDSTTRQMVKQDLRQLQKGDSDMSENLDTANVAKAVAHDCAKHVVHETWGKGQCIAGEHTLLEDGTVTHYDVMFEHGIEQDVPVADLTVLVSESHMHASKKKKAAMEEEAVTPEGGEDSSKASKKGKPEMPLEKLKAIMEKKKSKAYIAMLKSQGKMEEEVEQIDEFVDRETRLAARKAETGSSTRVSSGDVLGRRGGHETPKQAIARRVGKDSYGIKSGGKTSVYNRLPKPNLPEEAEQIDEISLDLIRRATQHAGYKAADHEAAAQDRADAGARAGDPEERAHLQAAKAYRAQQDRLRSAIHARKAKQFAKPLVSKAKLAKIKRKRVKEETELDEKKLTSAEMKKREEVAKAIERDQPGMPMGKKMAIATATAKKVAESYQALKESSDHEELAKKLYGHEGVTRSGESTYFEGPMKYSEQHSSDKARLDKHVPAAKEPGSHVFRIDGASGLVVHHKKGITALSSKNEVHHFEHGEEGHKKLQAHISKKFGMPHESEDRTVDAGAWKTSKRHKAEMQKHYDSVKAYVANLKSQGKMEENTQTKAVAEELVGNQHRIDANKNGKIDAHDFKLLRAKKKTMKEFVEQLAESLAPKGE